MAYLDHAASTPIRREVLDRMLPYLCCGHASPDADHSRGREARAVLEEARKALAQCLETLPEQLHFSRGQEEANRLALLVLARKHGPRGGHILVYRSSHPSILEACCQLESEGFHIDFLESGPITSESLDAALTEQTFLASFPWVDAWTGDTQPVAEFAELLHHRGVMVHLDASLTPPGEELNPDLWGLHALTVDAQQFQGPRNSALLWLAPQLSLDNPWRHLPEPQENQDLASVAGLAEAVLLGWEERTDWQARARALKGALAESLEGELSGFVWLSNSNTSLAIASLDFPDLCPDALCRELDHRGVCVSPVPSGGLRFSLGRTTTRSEIERAVRALRLAVEQLRATNRRIA